MIDRGKLLSDLQSLLRKLEADLLERSESLELQEEGINLLAFAAFPQGRRAQLDFIPVDQAAFKAAAKKAKIKLVGPKTGFVIQGDDRAGAVGEIASKLAEAGINITALHAVAAGAGRYGAILWVKPRDVNKAAKILL